MPVTYQDVDSDDAVLVIIQSTPAALIPDARPKTLDKQEVQLGHLTEVRSIVVARNVNTDMTAAG